MPKIDRQAIYERDGGLCGFCGEHVSLDEFQIDHIQPRGLGGTNAPENLRPAHELCNIRGGGYVYGERMRLEREARPPSPLMTVSEVATTLGVAQETVRRMLRSHRLPGNRLGPGRMGWRIKRADVDQLLLDHFSEKG